jgi:hypothetical protein
MSAYPKRLVVVDCVLCILKFMQNSEFAIDNVLQFL